MLIFDLSGLKKPRLDSCCFMIHCSLATKRSPARHAIILLWERVMACLCHLAMAARASGRSALWIHKTCRNNGCRAMLSLCSIWALSKFVLCFMMDGLRWMRRALPVFAHHWKMRWSLDLHRSFRRKLCFQCSQVMRWRGIILKTRFRRRCAVAR